MSRTVIGKGGLGAAVAVFAAMAITSFLYAPGTGLNESPGICLPDPSAWHIAPWLSWTLNLLLVAICGGGVMALNRRYTFVQSTDTLLPAALLVLVASCPWDVQRLCTGTLLLSANIITLHLLFGCRESANNTYRLFAAAALLSLGSAVQPAFLPFAVIYPVGAVMLRAMRLRELAAYLMGLLSPYVALLGLGLVQPADFRLELYPAMFDTSTPATDVFILGIGTGFTMLWGVLTGCSNTVQLLKANAELRRRNTVISLVGIVAAAGCMFNFPNLTAYIPTLALAVAVQLANAYALTPRRTGPLIPMLMLAAYIVFFLFCSSII